MEIQLNRISDKVTAFDVFMMIDNRENLTWTFDEREKYLCVLRNAKDIVSDILTTLTDKDWSERDNYIENLKTLNRYIVIAQKIRITDFDGRIEPKKLLETAITEDYVVIENGLKGWEIALILLFSVLALSILL